jgi:hypothetical protein
MGSAGSKRIGARHSDERKWHCQRRLPQIASTIYGVSAWKLYVNSGFDEAFFLLPRRHRIIPDVAGRSACSHGSKARLVSWVCSVKPPDAGSYPLSLFDIGASTAVYLLETCGWAADHAARSAKVEAEQGTRLLRRRMRKIDGANANADGHTHGDRSREDAGEHAGEDISSNEDFEPFQATSPAPHLRRSGVRFQLGGGACSIPKSSGQPVNLFAFEPDAQTGYSLLMAAGGEQLFAGL